MEGIDCNILPEDENDGHRIKTGKLGNGSYTQVDKKELNLI